MSKIIRHVYPPAFSIGLLALIFLFSCFLSSQIFEVPLHGLNDNKHVYIGMTLAGMAVVIMILILWEEILFPLRIKPVDGGLIFRNHRQKLLIQLLIYLTIPSIFIYIFLNYEVNYFRFFVWAAVCIVTPAVEKIASGINNYNDFLRLTITEIEYKNNEKVGCFLTKDIQKITIIEDESKILAKLVLFFHHKETLILDLDEMELDAFYDSIYKFIHANYKHLLG
jgi:hypothetical protein